jgi:hypothetical protein
MLSSERAHELNVGGIPGMLKRRQVTDGYVCSAVTASSAGRAEVFTLRAHVCA